MSKDDSKGSDGAGVAGISRNDIFVEANACNIEGNSNLLGALRFLGLIIAMKLHSPIGRV